MDTVRTTTRAAPPPSESQSDSKGKRMTIQLSDELAKHVEWLAETQGISQVEAIRKAIATESYFQQEIMQGAKVLIERNQSLREVIFR